MTTETFANPILYFFQTETFKSASHIKVDSDCDDIELYFVAYDNEMKIMDIVAVDRNYLNDPMTIEYL